MMSKLNRILGMLIAMLAIMIAAVGIDRGMKYYEHKKWISEREVFYEEARTDIAKMQATIQTLSEDREALASYMEENELNVVREEAYSVSGNSVSGDSVISNFVSGNSVSGNSVSGDSVISVFVSGNSVSGNSVSGDSILSSFVSGNGLQGQEACASYEETVRINQYDRKVIAESTIDFSDKKIVCLGDSITAATNLEGQEDYLKMSYPSQLGEILDAGEVVNLGIGGSSIGRYWENAFVDRYKEIPEDSDIIIVMGGTNDGFCASERELGALEKREKETFAGDLNELLYGLKEDYPDAEIILVTPLSNILHDMLRKNKSYLLPQSALVSIMIQLADEYEIPVIDLYHSGFLDSHDAAIIHSFIPDGVHGNEMGYRYLAEHIAAELIKIQQTETDNDSEHEQGTN